MNNSPWKSCLATLATWTMKRWVAPPRRSILLALLCLAPLAGPLTAAEPKELHDARQEFHAIKNPTEADRVHYLTRLVRYRETLTRSDDQAMAAIDAELLRHPLPATEDPKALAHRLVGRWMSPRRPYFYHADHTWAANEDTAENKSGTWRIVGNKFFQNYTGQKPDPGATIILLNDTDLIFGDAKGLFYLRHGTAFPWKT